MVFHFLTGSSFGKIILAEIFKLGWVDLSLDYMLKPLQTPLLFAETCLFLSEIAGKM
jgi:hypothetical protein